MKLVVLVLFSTTVAAFYSSTTIPTIHCRYRQVRVSPPGNFNDDQPRFELDPLGSKEKLVERYLNMQLNSEKSLLGSKADSSKSQTNEGTPMEVSSSNCSHCRPPLTKQFRLTFTSRKLQCAWMVETKKSVSWKT
jgi:hypothetical protein